MSEGKNNMSKSNSIVSEKATIGTDVTIGYNCIIEDDVTLGDNVYIDSNCIIRSGTRLGNNCFVGANCILGEYQMDFIRDRKAHIHELVIGNDAVIRSGSIIYTGSRIGHNFQTGHQVTIREKTQIGNNVSIGTLSDIQGNCKIGNYVRFHSNVHIGQLSIIDDFVWIFPYVVLTNDPTPPSENLLGVHVHSFAIIATGAIILPGMELGHDCLIGAGAIVTKSVNPFTIAVGNPAKAISDVRTVKNKLTGEFVYPWREHFGNYMPWDGIGFDAWYASLDLDEKSKYTLDNVIE